MQADIGRIIEQQPNFLANMRQYGKQVALFTERVLEAEAARTPVYVQYIPQNTETEVYKWLRRVLES